MWLYTTRGFYSVVEHKHWPDVMVIRARDKDDLKSLRKLHQSLRKDGICVDPKLKIRTSDTSDYPHRVFMSRTDFHAVAHALIDELVYPDFKTEVKRLQGAKRYSTYTRVWGIMHSLQDDEYPRYQTAGTLQDGVYEQIVLPPFERMSDRPSRRQRHRCRDAYSTDHMDYDAAGDARFLSGDTWEES